MDMREISFINGVCYYVVREDNSFSLIVFANNELVDFSYNDALEFLSLSGIEPSTGKYSKAKKEEVSQAKILFNLVTGKSKLFVTTLSDGRPLDQMVRESGYMDFGIHTQPSWSHKDNVALMILRVDGANNCVNCVDVSTFTSLSRETYLKVFNMLEDASIKQIIEKMPYQPMRRDDLIGLRRLMNKLKLV